MNWDYFFIGTAFLIIGLVIGFFAFKYYMKKSMQKTPPISDEMISAMLSGMGQTPTPKRLKQIKKQMTDAAKKQ